MTEPQSTALSTPRAQVAFGSSGLQLATLEDAYRFSTAVSKSGLAPRGIESPEAVLVAVQMGAEIGLTPMAALQNIAIINGRPGIYGDAALALVRGSGLLESYSQKHEGEGDARRAVIKTKRKGGEEVETSFSVADAKKAGLWGKSGPWSQYPDRMLLFRARGFNLRDNFGDVLKGLRTTEELGDIPADEPARGPDNAKSVTPAGGDDVTPPAGETKERPKTPRRGGARAAAAAVDLEVPAVPAPEPDSPAPQSAPASESQPSTTPPAAAAGDSAPGKLDAAPLPKCPDVAPGIDLRGFHGKWWPLRLTLQVKALGRLAVQPSGKPVAVLECEVEGHEGVLSFVTNEGLRLDTSGEKPKAVLDTQLFAAGQLLDARVFAKQRPKNGVPSTELAPALWLEDIKDATAATDEEV